MKNKKQENQETDYQAYLIIGTTFLVVGFIDMIRAANGEGFGIGYYIYAMYFFVQAFLRYHGEKELVKDF